MEEISLTSLGKELCGFVVSSKTGVYYTNGSFTKKNLSGIEEVITPKIQGYYIPIPKAWINEALAIEEGEDAIITSKELLEYDYQMIGKFLLKANSLSRMFITINDFMMERSLKFYAKGWIPLKTRYDTYIPSNETGILVYG